MDRIWGWDTDSDTNAVWVAVSNLRKTLKSLDSTVAIKSTRGVGYSLEDGK